LGESREVGTIVRLSKTDIAVWITTFALTVFADLTVAVVVGMALAALLYSYRIAETTTVEAVTSEYLEDGQAHILQDKDIPSNVTILRIHGPFLFGATEKLADAMKNLTKLGDVVILRLRNMTAIWERSFADSDLGLAPPLPSKPWPPNWPDWSTGCSTG
jgi:sulfate permease, SulP family